MSDALLVALNAQYIHTALGIRSLAAYAAGEFDVECLERTINDSFSAVIEDIYRRRAPIIGLSCYIWNIDWMMRIAQAIRAMLPDVHVVLGGPEVSYDAVSCMEQHPYIDAVFCGEGEKAFLSYLHQWKTGRDFSNVKGLCHRMRDGQICQNEPAEPINGEEIPVGYDFDRLPMAPQMVYYESSRGCPYRCGFCLSRGEHVRMRSAEKTIEHLKQFADANIAQVKMVDRTFNADLTRAKTIWRAISEWDTICNFHFEVAARTLDEEAIAILQNAPVGRIQLEIGIQSTHEPTKRAIEREESFEKIANAVKKIQKNHNVHIHLDLIAGLPHEGWEAFGDSFRAVYALQPDMFQLGFLKLLKGSRLREIAESFGCTYSEFAPYEVLKTDDMLPEALFALKRCEHALERYYHSSQCQRAVQYILQSGIDPFDFYVSLGNWIADKPIQKHINRLMALWTFAQAQGWHDEALRQLLLFDYIAAERRAKLPLETAEQDVGLEKRIRAFYRNHAKQYWGKQTQTPWRFSRIHAFDYDVLHYDGRHPLQEKKCFVLFDYLQRTQTEIVLPNEPD